MTVFTTLLGPPLLFLVSVPLAIFAAVTTTLAVTLLAIRVSVIYFELAIALVHAALFPEPPKPILKRAPLPISSPPRVRRGSSSSQDTVPAARLYHKSGSSASLVATSQMNSARDFEGVGGWRFYEGEEEEAIWMGMNKRLELPLAISPRRHQRRHTGEDHRPTKSPGALRMSPLQSRTRTPLATTTVLQDAEGDGYFPLQPVLRPLSTASEPLSMSVQHSRRASVVSVSGSSSSPSSSSPNSAKQIGE